MEYNIDLKDGLDIYQENSLTLILKQLKPNSTVLEFGPAYGRMTQYMKEQLGCRVSCVELNPNAENALREFSEKIVIGNIEDYSWTSIFDKSSFDYIIFADVLEHMINPEMVLRTTIPFLKEDGQIFISVPNIAHNAVIESLYLNRFEYQESGILDKTHLHFFTKDSLEHMADSAGLSIFSRNATYYSREMTGILSPSEQSCPELKMFLDQRPYANVYQLVYGMQLKNSINNDMAYEIEKKNQRYTFKVYFDFGNGFSEENTYEQHFCTEAENIFEINVKRQTPIKRLRIDPVDINCICEINEINFKTNDANEISFDINDIKCTNSWHVGNLYLFCDNDPQLVIENINCALTSLKISFSLSHIGVINSTIYKIANSLLESLTEISSNHMETIRNLQTIYEEKCKVCNERGIKVAELESMNILLQKESEERGIALNESQKVCDERGMKIAELHSLNQQIQQESNERAEKIESLEYQKSQIIESYKNQLDSSRHEYQRLLFKKNRELIKYKDAELGNNKV